MKSIYLNFLLVFCAAFFCSAVGRASDSALSAIPVSLQCLWAAYKNFKISADKNNVVFENGVELPYTNRDPVGTPVDPFHLTSIDQMFLTPYPLGPSFPTPGIDVVMRAATYSPFFVQLYGNSPEKVEMDLMRVQWVDGSSLLFNRKYGAAAALQRAIQRLKVVLAKHPDFMKFLERPLGGTYNWRTVAHETKLSMHSFGVAIDINTRYSDYWRWDLEPGGVLKYRNHIPFEIAEAFEQNGFVWGGKWYHYDTMHFEYRPEVLMSANECISQFADYRD